MIINNKQITYKYHHTQLLCCIFQPPHCSIAIGQHQGSAAPFSLCNNNYLLLPFLLAFTKVSVQACIWKEVTFWYISRVRSWSLKAFFFARLWRCFQWPCA
mmetsp:Transcript_28532/g.46534  ORF Transcript_28532/g.46534 Transcript_28532/m.46534 type:complete len:101 (-) Transcript_28532:1855-2157(-)